MNVKINDKQQSDDRMAEEHDDKRQPTFDKNKFLTNRWTVAFDEIFRWRKCLAIQYSFVQLFTILCCLVFV